MDPSPSSLFSQLQGQSHTHQRHYLSQSNLISPREYFSQKNSKPTQMRPPNPTATMHATILTVAFLLSLRTHAAPTPLTDAVTSSTSITIGDNLNTTAEPLDTTTITPSTLDESSDETPDETPDEDEDEQPSVYITIGDTVNRVAESSPSDADNANLQRLLELLTEHLARVKQSADYASSSSSNESSGFQRVPTSKALAHEDHGHEEGEEDKNGRPANAVIINKADMFPEGEKHEQQAQSKGEQHHDEASDFKDYQRQGQFKPQNQGGEGQEAVGFTIFCKGISVCNPVTIINGKGGRKLKIDKLEKFGRKSKGKLGEKFKKPF
ncbi:hypothetical protein B0J18DRAFT_252451 [Chaetomium sp. MPI-SDFR-AT-0129]|nr:hypothetical protein B0J18DRAFT_252451 [Chaetomium sp. MPI-SDFR-AT-0129]